MASGWATTCIQILAQPQSFYTEFRVSVLYVCFNCFRYFPSQSIGQSAYRSVVLDKQDKQTVTLESCDSQQHSGKRVGYVPTMLPFDIS